MTAASMPDLVERARAAAFDLDLTRVKRWKEETGGKAAGYFPIYVPRELLRACSFLPVGLFGGGDRIEIIRGDAYFQSYICHLPRSAVELLVSGRQDCLDACLFPSTCDVIRNLSGIWRMQAPDKYARYLDLPQCDDPALGAAFYERELRAIAADLAAISGVAPDEARFHQAIALYNENRRLIAELYELRRRSPALVPSEELYVVLRAGAGLPVEEHNDLIAAYLAAALESGRVELDLSRVVLVGAFCEQPPLDLVRTLARAGCYIVDDDFVLGMRWVREPIPEGGDPWKAIVNAYMRSSVASAARYHPTAKGTELVRSVRYAQAEGVVFSAASFCDPALLDQPMLQAALEREGIPYTSFKFSEDTGQFAVIREQAGTFADSIRLWS